MAPFSHVSEMYQTAPLNYKDEVSCGRLSWKSFLGMNSHWTVDFWRKTRNTKFIAIHSKRTSILRKGDSHMCTILWHNHTMKKYSHNYRSIIVSSRRHTSYIHYKNKCGIPFLVSFVLPRYIYYFVPLYTTTHYTVVQHKFTIIICKCVSLKYVIIILLQNAEQKQFF